MDLRFTLVIIAICLSLLLCGIELASVSTALPSIVSHLGGQTSFAWIGSAYTLGSSAILPLSGRLAELFGRRSTLLGSLTIFAAGSAIAGAAPSIEILVLGRAMQGVGSGGIQSLSQIVVADLVPLRKRGIYNALIGLVFTFTNAVGPFLGGAIVQRSSWRWLFYLNLPLCAIAFIVVFLCLRLKTPPPEHLWKKISRLDIVGNCLVIASSTSCIIALTWAGVEHPWDSAAVLIPLILGLFGLAVTIIYEIRWAKEPMMPRRIITNPTALSGYLMSFVHGIVIINVSFYLPVYFQAVKVASPLASGLYFFCTGLTASPVAMLQGIIVAKTGKYRLLIISGWSVMLVGIGLISTLGESNSVWISLPYQIIFAVGWAFLYATSFVVLAPLDVTDNASALALLVFARTFSQSWGVAIGASILQNQLQKRLPIEFLNQFIVGKEIAYSAIPLISGLPSDLQRQVRIAFSDSLKSLWYILLGFTGAGLSLVMVMKELPLQTATDKKWGLKESTASSSDNEIEKGTGTGTGTSSTGTGTEIGTETEPYKQ